MISAVLAVSGCAPVGPNYQEPQIPTPDVWYGEVSDEVAQGSEALLQRWWQVFDDPALDGLIERARTSNLDVRMAISRIREARARLGFSKGGKMPVVTGSASAQATELSDVGELEQVAPAGGFEPQGLFYFGVDAIWEIDVFGRIRRSIEAAGAGYQASVEDYRDVLVTLFAEVARAYVDLREADERLANVRRNIEAQRESMELAEDRFESGLSSRLDVTQALSNLSETEAAVPPLQIQRNLALNRLAVLLGQDAGSLQAEFSDPGTLPTPAERIGLGVPAEILRRRPDVRRAERLLAAQTARIGIATADLYPRFALGGFLGFQSRNLGDLASGKALTWGIGFPIQWNLFDGKRTRSRIAVEEERTDQALMEYKMAVLRALEEVENSIVSYNQQSDRGDLLARAISATEDAVSLAMVQYDAGLTDFQNVLDTQRTLFGQQDTRLVSEAKTALGLIGLYKSLGGGWNFAGADSMDPLPGEEIPEAPRTDG